MESSREVLVTGGTSGIGLAIAARFAAAGYDVVAAGLAPEQCRASEPPHAAPRPDDLPDETWAGPRAPRRPGRLLFRELDVTDPEQVEQVLAQHKRLDVVVNAAGILLREEREFDPAGFSRVVDVNLLGTMRVCYAARERLFATRGCVINLASMLSFFGSPYVPGYSASKGAVVQLTRSLAIAWGPGGVRVNALAPGWIETPMTAALRSHPGRSEEILRRTPLGRWGGPDDVAAAAIFLASPAAAFITGVVLPVDGGYSIA